MDPTTSPEAPSLKLRHQWRRAGAMLTVVAVAALTSGATVAPAAAVDDPMTRLEFLGSGDPLVGRTHAWTVPAGVGTVHFDVYGAQGGGCDGSYGSGGLGGLTAATISVTPGEVLWITPGSQGGSACWPGGDDYDNQAPGGFNGGGSAGRMTNNVWTAGGGGGGSDVRRPPYAMADRILTAGGGGGGASQFADKSPDGRPHGGAGGGTAGDLGLGNGQGGKGGTQLHTGGGGGPNGGGGTLGYAGGFGSGGDGASDDGAEAPGGGGGGGWFGGGGGGSGALTGGGGGGGSGNGPPDATLSRGVNAGSGRVVATFEVDTSPPELGLPADITREATSASGARITFAYAPTDPSGVTSASCTRVSGSTFPIGTTTVSCTAADRLGNTANGSFRITVGDATPPALSLPDPITVEATSPTGATVTYSYSATDASGVESSSCTPESGSMFSIGTTAVTCTAADASRNTTTGTFTVTVRDTTPPVLSLPAGITANATSPSGAAVSYAVSATDFTGVVTSCAPASGSTFPVGATTVSCTAVDAFDNTATGSFNVSVKGAQEQLTDLLPRVTGVGTGQSLADKVRTAQSYQRSGDTTRACQTLSSFINEVRAQAGKKKITAAQAQDFTQTAERIRAAIGC